ncbi:MAG: hypothetical protein KKA07_09560 [Bacteroidetes bacterium]|nr:hypothetical protein [Bacteroidota bacterium]
MKNQNPLIKYKHHFFAGLITAGGTATIIAISLILQIVSAQSCTTPPSGLVSWWPGDGNPEDIIDSNLGYLTNGATPTGAGEVGQAFDFDGTNDYLAVPNN